MSTPDFAQAAAMGTPVVKMTTAAARIASTPEVKP